MENTNNKEYWEKYVGYWKEKVDKTNTKEVKDKTLDDDILGTYIQKLQIDEKDKFLDFGCGFCRLYPYYVKLVGADNYYGVDIAEAPLDIARENYLELNINGKLKSYDGMKIPYADNEFQRIVCFGVFDACDQETILKELFRVLDKEGQLLITGKNNLYHVNDEEAYIAEVNARKKGHPNYFTDVAKMIKSVSAFAVVKEEYYFERRGDFPDNKPMKERKDIFYEWALILEKKNEVTSEIEPFSNAYSETFRIKVV